MYVLQGANKIYMCYHIVFIMMMAVKSLILCWSEFCCPRQADGILCFCLSTNNKFQCHNNWHQIHDIELSRQMMHGTIWLQQNVSNAKNRRVIRENSIREDAWHHIPSCDWAERQNGYKMLSNLLSSDMTGRQASPFLDRKVIVCLRQTSSCMEK